MGTFEARTAELADMVGAGDLTGKVTVDQLYAQFQHEGLDLRHSQGGQAKFLEAPLFANAADYVRSLSKDVLTGGLVEAMTDNMEHLSRQVYELAPIDFGDLKASAAPRVIDGGTVAYNRPANVHRLTDEELDAKRYVKSLGF